MQLNLYALRLHQTAQQVNQQGAGMQNGQPAQQRLIGVSGIIPVHLENRLHNLAASNRRDFDLDYSDTFAQVIALGVDALQSRRSSAYVRSTEIMKKVCG
ncbi:MAG: hypothetical protein A2Z87_06140 [Gallionellales bacterium GWA2_54_124]|nr:MAG: hypothetical protein A2Z87_06140 [Gallionellales bacterium GWA2_54_124]